jgi:hypothetical protein
MYTSTNSTAKKNFFNFLLNNNIVKIRLVLESPFLYDIFLIKEKVLNFEEEK